MSMNDLWKELINLLRRNPRGPVMIPEYYLREQEIDAEEFLKQLTPDLTWKQTPGVCYWVWIKGKLPDDWWNTK